MLTRCYNPASLSYENYGRRGIDVSDEWHKFENFFADMNPRPSPAHSLDRIDNDQGYSKENCRWATREDQMGNRRGCIYIETAEGKLTVAAAARKAGISWTAMRNRVKCNVPVAVILTPKLKLCAYR